MKRKSLLFLLLFALMAPWTANAQETDTVYNGTSTSSYVPLNGNYADYGTRSQFIIPATQLEELQDGTITKLTFFANVSSASFDEGFTVYLKEVNYTTFETATFEDWSTMTDVWTGNLSVVDNKMEIDFSNSGYTYNGGNLMIGLQVTTWGNSCPYFAWYGESQSYGTYTAVYNNANYSHTWSTTINRVSFIPKTVLTYEPASSECPNPKTFVASDVTAHGATMTWTMEDETGNYQFNLEYKKTTEETWTRIGLGNTRSYPLSGLVAETEYNVRIQTVCDPENDKWKNLSPNLTTDVACPAPTNLAVTDGSVTAREATVTWEGTSQSYVVMIGQENLLLNANFEDNAIPAALTNSTSYPWTVMAGGANGSDYCIVPGNHEVNSSDSDLTFEVTLDNPATVSFWAKISSEGSSDYGRFLIDGTQKLSISGTSSYTTWTKYEYELTAGSHTLIWRYHKDISIHSGSDYFYVDDIIVSAGVASWTEYTTTAQTYPFENLTPNRSYQVKVKGNCGSEGYSAETEPVSFTTLESCPAPTGLAIVEGYPTAHGVSFTWNYEEGEVFQFSLPIGNVTDPEMVTWNTTWYAGDNFPIYDNQPADADRTFWLRKKCGDSDFSDPVSITFHFLEACPAPTGFALVPNSITGHTASFNWEGTSESYNVWYRTAACVDGIIEEFNTSGIPSGWTRYRGLVDEVIAGTATLSTTTSGWNTDNYALGTYNVKVNVYGTSCKYWLVTPEFTLSQDLSFDLALTDYGNADAIEDPTAQDDDRFVVLIYADDAWHILREWNNSGSGFVYNSIATTGETVNIGLSNYYGKDVKLAFYTESTVDDNGDNDLHIDNITCGLPVAAGVWQNKNTTTAPYELTGLAPKTDYEVYVQGDCGEEGLSNPTTTLTFTTDVACPAPTALNHANVKSTQVDLSWTNGGAEDWVVAYKKTADENFTEVNVGTDDVTIEGTTVTYTLTGLDEETDYTVKVRDNCEASIPGDGMSAWSSTTTSFTTMAACSVDNVTISEIGHFTAKVNWDGESANGFTVKYREAEHIDGVNEEFGTSIPEGWSTYNGKLTASGSSYTATLSSSSSWSFGTWSFNNTESTDEVLTGHHARVNIYGNYQKWLVTPAFTVNNNALTFDMALTNYYADQTAPQTTGSDDKFMVLVSTDNMATWNILREWNNENGAEYVYNNINHTATGESVSISMSNYVGQEVYIAFYGESTTSNADNYIHIDNVVCGNIIPATAWEEKPSTENTANLSQLTAGTKYDLTVVPNCDETLASAIQQFTTVSPNVKYFLGTESDEWLEGGNWEPTGAPTISQDVVLKANATIASGEAFAKSISGTGTGDNDKTLTIENGGKLKHLNSGVRATVKKHIIGYTNYQGEGNGGYYLITNPTTSSVTPSAANGFLVGNYDLYNWDYEQADEWRNFEAQGSTFTSLNSSAYGYLYANENGTDLTYTGTIYSYTSYRYRSASVASNPDNYDFPSWYLLGNPYLYDAYLANSGSNGTALPYVKMNTDGDGFENVAAGTPIAPMEGFFYQGVSGATSAYVVTSEPTVPDAGLLNMNLRSGNKQLDNAILVFGSNQQLGKMSFRANSSKVYMPVENKDYAIVSTESNVGEMPVSFKAEKNGSYSLSFNTENVEFGYLHLIDNLTGNDVDLLANPSYSFEAKTTDYASRFKLVFATGSNANDESFAFMSDGNLIVNNEGEATLQVIDVNGRILRSERINGSASINMNTVPGVYMIRVINGDNVRTQKMVVK